jgi:type I restriction enzyme, S subunit
MIADLKPYPEYKESGSKWLGAVPAHWGVRNLRTLVSKRAERDRADLPLLSVAREKGVFVRSLTDADENHNVIPNDLTNYKVARAGNLVINKMKAWQGSMGIAPCDGIVSPAYFVFDFRIANHAFGHSLLRSKPYVAHFGQASDGVRVGQWDLTVAGMRQIPVLVPEPFEQAAIVRFLDWSDGLLDRAIRAKRKVIALVNEQKRTIIHRAVTRGLNPSAPFKPSGIPWLGDIPQHWEVRKLKFEVSFRGGGTPSKGNAAYWNGTIPWVSPKDMKFEIIHDAEDHITERAIAESSTSLVPSGSLLMVVRSGILQRAIPVARCVREVALNQDMKALSSKGRLDLDYFVLFIRGSEKQLVHEWTKQGATVESVEHQYLANTKVLVPPLPEQMHIVEQVALDTGPLTTTISRLEREIALLREYRTRLVADLVTGKLDVREAVRRLPEKAAEPEPVADTEPNPEEAEV